MNWSSVERRGSVLGSEMLKLSDVRPLPIGSYNLPKASMRGYKRAENLAVVMLSTPLLPLESEVLGFSVVGTEHRHCAHFPRQVLASNLIDLNTNDGPAKTNPQADQRVQDDCDIQKLRLQAFFDLVVVRGTNSEKGWRVL